MTSQPILLSICIPSYNRPELIARLLASIDAPPGDVEIVVGEDKAPRREEVRAAVGEFRRSSPYAVNYYENEHNLSYDKNVRGLIEQARGDFVLFMGDDDWFIPGKLGSYLEFLRANRDVGYVLRSYCAQHPNGKLEMFSYCPETRRFAPGIDACVFHYKRTVSIGGVTFRRERALQYATDRFDGLLLYQLYLVAEVALHEPTIYCDIPVAIAAQTFREDNAQFGTALAERKAFQPGKITAHTSVNFTKGFFVISKYIDGKYGIDTTTPIRRDLSKYAYPFLSIQRKRGRREFLAYACQLARETQLNQTWHYYFYSAALWLFGENMCDKGIVRVKRLLGHTPRL
ncbi:MAG: glycosyltransferase family 2 protein [Pseudomonadota bacterium]